jgi:enoyl-CoA hydratase/carnithine racemase
VSEFETLEYEAGGGVAVVTLNRPERHNAYNTTMRAELSGVWRLLRDDDDVHAVVLTGAGDKAFCTGIDRDEIPTGEGYAFDPIKFEDPGRDLGPKSNGLWKPVIAAVNGMACGGAFYMLGEVEFIIAAEHATFFDPHLTYGMTAVFEPILMLKRMPFGELMRMTMFGARERMTAGRAHQIGLVSEVVAGEMLLDAARDAAAVIAEAPPRAVQSTLRTLWAARELPLQQALELGGMFLNLGTSGEEMTKGQEAFASGRRAEYRLR